MRQQHQIFTGLFLSLVLMLVGMSNAYSLLVGYDTTKMFGRVGVIGYVYLDGHPILSEYDSEGKWVKDIGWQESYNNIDIMSGNEYRAVIKLFEDYRAAHPEYDNPSLTGEAKGARLMSRQQFDSKDFISAIDSSVTVNKPRLKDNTRTVLVAAENTLLTANSPLVLMEFPILMNENTSLDPAVVSLIIDKAPGKEGEIIYQSNFQISYKVDAYNNREEQVLRRDLVLTAPLTGIPVTGSLGDWEDIQDVSDSEGKWEAQMDPWLICPWSIMSRQFNWAVVAKVPYTNFNPKAGDHQLIYRPVLYPTIKSCNFVFTPNLGFNLVAQMVELEIANIIANTAWPAQQPMDILVSTMKLNGVGMLYNVALGQETVYVSDDTPIPYTDPNASNFDFDGDGEPDNVQLNGSQVDVYLNQTPGSVDASGNPIEPYFTRLADRDYGSQLLHQGLLQSISVADLEDTDVYFFRQSTGHLVGHLEGLVEGAPSSGDASQSEQAGIVETSYNGVMSYRGVHTDSPEAKFGFSSLLLGARTLESKWTARGSFIDGGTADRYTFDNAPREPWVDLNYDSPGSATDFADRSADFLIPGEKIKMVAVNRKTGYIGTKITQLGSPEKRQYTMDVPDGEGYLDHALVMGPPNLKIRVTRDYKVEEGLTKDEERRFIIGSEGAGLTSDKAIAIQTIWLDHDGSPLPDSLPGYTARIAISTGDSTKSVSDNYEVKPGIQTGVIQLPGKLASAAKHFYVQLVGENFDGNPSFAGPGAGEGKLATRPKYYVPVMVPIFNEAETRHQENMLRDAKAAGQTGLPDNVNPIYEWVYRPEMMFSVYDWEVQQIYRATLEGEFENIIDLERPVIGSGDLVNIFYTLMEQAEPELDRFSGDRELILEIGGEEIELSVSDDQVTFFNLDQLDLLAYEDYLSIRLYQNNDSFNTLWEFAFKTVDIDVDSDNNNGLELPERTKEEDIESDASQPGKILIANTGDTDEDGFPNFADFDAGEAFVPMIIEIPDNVDASRAKILFTYQESDPTNITAEDENGLTVYKPAPGYLRLWTKNGDESRNISQISSGGNLVKSDMAYDLTLFDVNDETNEITFYIESVKEFDTVGGLSMAVEFIEQ